MCPRSVTTGRRYRSLAVLVTVLALTLAACSGDSTPLPDDPGEAVAAAFENRFEDGTTVTMTVELTDRATESLLEDVEAAERDVAERFYDAVTGVTS